MTDEGLGSEPARNPQDLEQLLVSRERAGDVDAIVTAEIARRQGDGSWLWVIDQFRVA